MGREAVAVVRWQGETAEVALHLDATYLTLRGDIRADLRRSEMTGICAVDSGVAMQVAGNPLVLEFGATDAARWVKALLKPPPTLAQKLGVSDVQRAFVVGTYEDAALEAALDGAQVGRVDDAAFIVAIVHDELGLMEAEAAASEAPEKHLWMIYGKGKGVEVGGMYIRSYLRDLGYRDSKSCAVSDRYTATRYRKPVG